MVKEVIILQDAMTSIKQAQSLWRETEIEIQPIRVLPHSLYQNSAHQSGALVPPCLRLN